jgi:hypothetical protein
MNNTEVERDQSKREVKSRLVYGLCDCTSLNRLWPFIDMGWGGLIMCEARITCKSCQIQSKPKLDNKNWLGPILRSTNRLGPVLIAKTVWPVWTILFFCKGTAMVLSILYMDKNRSRFRNLQTSLRLLVTFCTPHLELMAETMHFNCIHLFFRLPDVNVNLNEEFNGVFPWLSCHIERE